jgi:hypothetical protein
MSTTSLGTTLYEDEKRQVRWHGVGVDDGDEFKTFMTKDVASRLHDEEGMAEFEAHVRGLANTGFARESLDAVLAAELAEERDWAVGEALAEAYLEREHKVTWPWNAERDKRNPKASLPGADLVGFGTQSGRVCLVLGEVKTSTDAKTPPGVMSGRHGMTHQLGALAQNLTLICQLLKWLLPRCKGAEHEVSFNAAVGLFFESGNSAVALFGVLIRDTKPDELDLKARGQKLAGGLQAPTTCELIAIYLPCTIADLPARATEGES